MSSPEIKIGCVANLWTRQMHFVKAGDVEQGHTHNFDHMTLVGAGKVKVKVNDKESVFAAGSIIYISKDKVHELTALEDNTICYCIHALRKADGSGDILDPEMIPAGIDAYSIAQPITT